MSRFVAFGVGMSVAIVAAIGLAGSAPAGRRCVVLSGGQYGCPVGSSSTVVGGAHWLVPVRAGSPLDAFAGRTYSQRQGSFTGVALLGVPHRDLRPGTLRVRVHVDDGPVLSGRSRLPA